MRALTVSEFVRYCTLEGRVVVLDLRVGSYLVFDAVASKMWNVMLAPGDESERVERLAADFDISADRVREDLAAFVRNCAQRNLIRDPASGISESAERLSSNGARTRPPTIFHAWLCLYTTRRTLARRGFSWAYQRIYDLPKPTGDPDGVRLRARSGRLAGRRISSPLETRGLTACRARLRFTGFFAPSQSGSNIASACAASRSEPMRGSRSPAQ